MMDGYLGRLIVDQVTRDKVVSYLMLNGFHVEINRGEVITELKGTSEQIQRHREHVDDLIRGKIILGQVAASPPSPPSPPSLSRVGLPRAASKNLEQRDATFEAARRQRERVREEERQKRREPRARRVGIGVVEKEYYAKIRFKGAVCEEWLKVPVLMRRPNGWLVVEKMRFNKALWITGVTVFNSNGTVFRAWPIAGRHRVYIIIVIDPRRDEIMLS